MSKMHRLGAWPSPGVQVKGFALLVEIEDRVHVSMREKYPPSQKVVWLASCDFFKTTQ